jgi:YegS/Rv2252/BmrU family lipid kinase
VSLTDQARRWLLLGAGACFVVALTLCVMGANARGTLHEWDSVVQIGPDHWYAAHHGWKQPLVVVSQGFNTVPMAAYALLASGILLLRRHPRAAILVVISSVAVQVLTPVLKAVVDRPRPVLADPIVSPHNASMPSGHAAYIATAVTLVAVLVGIFVRKRPIRRIIVAVGVLLALLVGLDRLLLGVHTLTDVVAGYALGAGVVLVAAALFDPAPALISAEPLAPAPGQEHKLACILNPIKVEDVGGFQAMVERMAEDAGLGRPDWYLTTVEDPGRSMAEQAAISGATVVLVCGGDGTVRTVCGELAGTGIPVGIVPAGTGNLLARNLELPLYLRSAVDVALNGQDRAIDLVHVSGDGIGDAEHYLVMAGMGFDAAIMEGANEQLKAKVGWIAYVISALRNLMYPDVRVEISVDGGDWTKHRARTIVIGNVGNLQGGLPLLPDATIDDGTIDLVLIYPARFLSWLRVVVRVLSRNSRSDETVTRMTGRRISVRAGGPIPRQVDGDSIGAGHELHCECLPGKLLIRVAR